MTPPIITFPEEFNKVLYTLHESGALHRETLLDILASTTFHGRIPKHGDTIDAALGLGLLRYDEEKYHITSVGQRVLAPNVEGTYELAPGQAGAIFESCIAYGGYRKTAKLLFARFTHRGVHCGLSLDTRFARFTEAEKDIVSLLRRLGVILVSGAMLLVTPSYADRVSALRSAATLTLSELDELLRRRREQGTAAEEFILKYEQERLRKEGFGIEADAVTIISDIDVCAGFDIESFSGASDDLKPNRFIEVKSTSSDENVFFWSVNEFETAKELGSQYWIYHVANFSLDEGDHLDLPPRLTQLQDPALKKELGIVSLETAAYRAHFR
jgi:hypothetical protein